MADSDKCVNEGFADIAAGRGQPVYGMNFLARTAQVPTYLADVPHNIRVGVHPHLNRSVGINVPTHYLAGRLAFSGLHLEDGCLDSCNLMHWGEQGAEKLWLFVSSRFNAALCRVVRDKLRELDAGGEQVPYNVECNTPLHHKNLVLTPAFLKANGIPYHVISQRPGTFIYVCEGVFHQVINTDLNLVEAVNVGGLGWNHAAHIFVACGCTGYSVEEISPNPVSYETLTEHSTRLYECPKQGCLHTSATATQARQHARVHARGNSNRPQVFCH